MKGWMGVYVSMNYEDLKKGVFIRFMIKHGGKKRQISIRSCDF